MSHRRAYGINILMAGAKALDEAITTATTEVVDVDEHAADYYRYQLDLLGKRLPKLKALQK